MTPSPSRSVAGTRLSKRLNNHSLVLNETSIFPEPLPLIPDICLELQRSVSCSAKPSAAFMTEDYIGQTFLCLLFPQILALKCYKYEIRDGDKFILGPETLIPARDAASLDALKVMIVVDSNNCLVLYTGISYICRLHLAGLSTFNSTLFKDFSYLNISSKLNSPLGTPLRRSSLLTSRPTSANDLKFETALSPVVSENPPEIEGHSFLEDPSLPLSAAILSVQDATGCRITLEHTSGYLYRVSLPYLSSSTLVEKALSALKYMLPKEFALQLLIKWYTNRNAPGNGNFSAQTEWNLFSRTLMALIGYDVEKLSPSNQLETLSEHSSPSSASSKKFRATESGSDNDWDYLLSSSYHQNLGKKWGELLQLAPLDNVQDRNKNSILTGTLNSSAPLFHQLPTILFTLHLIYEEFKTTTLHWELTQFMIPCLSQLAADLGLSLYLNHYWKDFPSLCSLKGPSTQVCKKDLEKLNIPSYFCHTPPNLYQFLYSLISGNLDCPPFANIPSVCSTSKNLILLYEVAVTNRDVNEVKNSRYLKIISPDKFKNDDPDCALPSIIMDSENIEDESLNFKFSVNEKIVSLTDSLGLTQSDVRILSPGLSLILMNAQHLCRTYPPLDWKSSTYKLIERPDLCAQKLQTELQLEPNLECKGTKTEDDYHNVKTAHEEGSSTTSSTTVNIKSIEDEDGMETLDMAMLGLRWPEDQRVSEVRKMLQSSKPAIINIPQKAGVSDHEFLEEQERHLYAMCIRTMALPMGRGMFTLCTHSPIITEALPIPTLNLKGRAPSRGTTIDFPVNEIPPDMDMWPLFHNGVAAGLKIAPNCDEITSTWISYNKSKVESSMSHAGFLMSLGLSGHLRNFASLSLYDYLKQGHELTCVGLLLGISVAMRSTMDLKTTKVLVVHLERLLPPTSTELDIPHTVQVRLIE